jgi:hypothetical protein
VKTRGREFINIYIYIYIYLFIFLFFLGRGTQSRESVCFRGLAEFEFVLGVVKERAVRKLP